MSHYDYIVIGAGVIGTSVAHHLAELGATSVLVLDRGMIGAGTTSQSSGLLRTHYSVRQNVELARRSWSAFNDFSAYVGDEEASCGLVKCGYMICAPEGDKLEPLSASLDAQREMGIEVELLSKRQAHERLPIAHFDNAALIGYEPEAGFADAYLVATSFARSARRRGIRIMENTVVTELLREGRRVTGVATSAGHFTCGTVISTQNIWTPELAAWIGVALPVKPERHTVLALECGGAA
jgi:sarcosine oxidase subunit beta